MIRKILCAAYSVLSLFVGIWELIKWISERMNSIVPRNQSDVFTVVVCVIAIISPIILFSATKKKQNDVLKSIKDRFIEDEAVLPSTLSYLIDTVIKPEKINRGVSVENIIERITIGKAAPSGTAKSIIIREFNGIHSDQILNGLDIRCNHHIFSDTSDYFIKAKYCIRESKTKTVVSVFDWFTPICKSVSKSTMNISIPFHYPISNEFDVYVAVVIKNKERDIHLKDTIETFPIDPERLFSNWTNLQYRIRVLDPQIIRSRSLQLIAFNRPTLKKQISATGLYIDRISATGRNTLSIDRKDKLFRKDSIYVLTMRKKD